MKIYYKEEPHLEAIPLKNEMRLVDDWYFCIGNRVIYLPSGYRYNGASIPPIPLFWETLGSPFSPKLQAAALGHDYAYLTHIVDRATADDAIYQLMRQDNKVGTIRAHLIWAAVRSFGQIPWHNFESDRKDLNELRTMISKRPDKEKFGIV